MSTSPRILTGLFRPLKLKKRLFDADLAAPFSGNVRLDQETETVIGDSEANLYVSRKYRTHWSTPKWPVRA